MGLYKLWTYVSIASVALSAAALLTLASLLAMDGQDRGQPSMVPRPGAVPKAQCGPGDRTESGLQGQTTLAERFSSASSRAYNCNLELVGQFEGEGANWDLAVLGDCAYFGTANGPRQQHRGTVVVDAADPRHPKATAYLDSNAMLEPNESLDVHAGRKLLAGARSQGTDFDIYDLAANCRQPVLKANIKVPGITSHAGNFAPDGRTYYGTFYRTGPASDTDVPPGMYAIDVTDPSKPREIVRWTPSKDVGVPHHVYFSEDGTRAYVGLIGHSPPAQPSPNGFAIVDVSDIQRRRPNPEFRLISRLVWEDGNLGQIPLPVTIKGRPYLIYTDAAGPGGAGAKASAAACAQGLPPHGFARVVDISDVKNPKVISKLMLEVSDPANCSQVLNDPVNFIGYSVSFCAADNPRNAQMLACTYYEAGLRVFDIRDPYHPREVAYYKPPARRKEIRPGSFLFTTTGGGDRTADAASFPGAFRKDKGEIWFVSQDNGLQIVRFTDRFRAAHKDLF